MLINSIWTLTTLLLTTEAQPAPITWETLLEKLQQVMPIQLWIALMLVVPALLFLLDIGDKLSAILSWLGVESPFRQPVPPESDRKARRKILKDLQEDVELRLARSLHKCAERDFLEGAKPKRAKLDRYMKDQWSMVGKRQIEVVPENGLEMLLANRCLKTFNEQQSLPISLESTQKIVDVFERDDIQKKLLILGEPGAGKTTELLRLADDLLKRAFADENLPFPLILELSSWDESTTIEQWVADVLKKQHDIHTSITQQWLQDDDIILLLDGLDELGLMGQQKCIATINTYVAEKRRHGLAVCCRREEYEAGQAILDTLNGAVYLEPLRDEQIKEFCDQLNQLRLWERIRANAALLKLARTPLFLFMLAVGWQERSITNKGELFDTFIEQRFEKVRNKKKTIYSPRQTLTYLVWLAQQLESTRETEFLIENLQPSMLRQCRKESFFYNLITDLTSGLLAVLLFGLLVGSALWPIYGLIDGWKGGLLCGLFFVLMFAMLARLDRTFDENGDIEIGEKLKFSFSRDSMQMLGAALSAWLIAGLVVYGLGVEYFMRSIGLSIGVSGGLLTSLLICLSSVLIMGLLYGLTGHSESINNKNFPNQGIWRSLGNSATFSLIFGLLSGLLVGLPVGLLVGLIPGLISGLLSGLIVGLSVGLRFGLAAVIQHVALRIVLTVNGHTPWNYARFLDHAVELRFMQRVGGRYRFTHDLLRKHFAAMLIGRRLA